MWQEQKSGTRGDSRVSHWCRRHLWHWCHWCRRHLSAAIQLAVSCCELYFTRCCAVKRTGTFASESKVMCLFYLILRSGVMFRIPNINQCVKNFLRLRKVEFIKWINLINVLFIRGFLSNSSRLTNQFCVWFSLVRPRTAGEFFLCHFLRKKTA